MADATTPAMIHPTSALSTGLTTMKGLTMSGQKGTLPFKIADNLETSLVETTEQWSDEDATVDTAASTAEFFIELLAELATVLAIADLKPLGLDVDWVPFKIGDYYVFTGTIGTASLVRFETLTFDDSAATLALSFGADLTVGAARVIVARLLSGTISAADAVLSGAAGTLTITAGAVNQAGGANNRCPGIGGRLKVGSTGLAHASQTSIPLAYKVEGTPAA